MSESIITEDRYLSKLKELRKAYREKHDNCKEGWHTFKLHTVMWDPSLSVLIKYGKMNKDWYIK